MSVNRVELITYGKGLCYDTLQFLPRLKAWVSLEEYDENIWKDIGVNRNRGRGIGLEQYYYRGKMHIGW